MEAQRGFSLLELLVAAAISFVLAWQLLAFAHTMILGTSRLDARLRTRSAVERLDERLSSDAASAWSVFVPVRDLTGADNTDGHELDFVTEDASRRSFWWAYAYDSAVHAVVNYAYVPGGGRFAGETYEGIASFAARTYPITDITHPSSDAYDPLFASAVVTAVDVPFGWNRQAVGGNHVVRVRCTGGGLGFDALLAAGTAPSRFTVVVDYTPAPPTPTP